MRDRILIFFSSERTRQTIQIWFRGFSKLFSIKLKFFKMKKYYLFIVCVCMDLVAPKWFKIIVRQDNTIRNSMEIHFRFRCFLFLSLNFIHKEFVCVFPSSLVIVLLVCFVNSSSSFSISWRNNNKNLISFGWEINPRKYILLLVWQSE